MLQRLCTGASKAILLVAQGTAELIDFELQYDADYAAELMRRADIFLNCLRTLTPPFPMPPAPPPREKWRTIDVDVEPTNWSGELAMFLQLYDDTAVNAALHDEMGKAARDLIPDNVGKVFAGAFQITRNRKGTLDHSEGPQHEQSCHHRLSQRDRARRDRSQLRRWTSWSAWSRCRKPTSTAPR